MRALMQARGLSARQYKRPMVPALLIPTILLILRGFLAAG
ncbi:Unknown protein sequence [Pseudomonas savastanoi pv. phaseolicola]|nr:Unknown protein sequence [Pseudomonas savastanoi pv. phaseolicola]